MCVVASHVAVSSLSMCLRNNQSIASDDGSAIACLQTSADLWISAICAHGLGTANGVDICHCADPLAIVFGFHLQVGHDGRGAFCF